MFRDSKLQVSKDLSLIPWPKDDFLVERTRTIALHSWGPEFASRSFHIGLVVDKSESEQVFLGNFIVFLGHKYLPISLFSSHPFCSFNFTRTYAGTADLVTGGHPIQH